MKSLKYKLMIPIISMILIFIGIIYIQIIQVDDDLKMINELEQKYFKTLSRSEELKFSVVQVQQWLTDISATRAASGYDDGFAEAENHANSFKTILKELVIINPEYKEEIAKIDQKFNPYYETGKRMAKAYIEGGPDSGNQIMEEFDKTAQAINNEVDLFKERSREQIELKISHIEAKAQKTKYILIASILMMIVLSVVVWVYITKGIIKPIQRLVREVNLLAEKGGDLTQKIDINSQDEIGELVSSLNKFIDNLRMIMTEVNKRAAIVNEAAVTISNHLNGLNAYITDTSATVEELTAGMEETAASAEQVNISSAGIETSIEAMAEKILKGATAAAEINTRASELKSNANTSQQTAQVIYEEAKLKLQLALEQAKAIDKITFLSDAILEISSQTNLLALNAAIEAARAGEAGRGFSVVAEQIRILAEDSKRTVHEILGVTKEVVSSVENLSGSSRTLMDFLDVNVKQDYENMIITGEQYNNDAVFVNRLITDFNLTTQDLTVLIEGITRAINSVAMSVEEGATGTQIIAQKTMDILEKMSDVHTQVQISMESAQRLKDAIGKFKV